MVAAVEITAAVASPAPVFCVQTSGAASTAEFNFDEA